MSHLRYPTIWGVMVPSTIRAAVIAASVFGAIASAHAESTVAFPIYRAEHALQGIYSHRVTTLWQAFEREATGLTQAVRQHCDGQADAASLLAAWSRARLAWMAASNPALGPVITRRSQRVIDFWPVRTALLQRALTSNPQSLAEMERVGGPAKGFPTMEILMTKSQSQLHCPYLVLITDSIEAEAKALTTAFTTLSVKDWMVDEDAARNAFAEWVNQWLGGLENLRWQQIEQPIHKARTAGARQTPTFARRSMKDNLADWRAQWDSLRVQARLTPEHFNAPPKPGQDFVPIEALLRGEGQIELADRWGNTVDAASSAMSSLPDRPAERDLLALSQTLKAVTALYQSEVAAALNVPLGFSSADGD